MLAAKRLSRELRKKPENTLLRTKVGLGTGEGVRLDLHQNLGRNESRYLHHRSGRPYVAETFAVGTPNLLPLCDVHYIDARAYDVLHAGSRLRERALNILERLHCLRLNVPYADDLAIRPGRRGSRNMDVRSDFYRARVADDRLPRCAARNVLTLHATLRGPQFYKSEMSRSVGVDFLELFCARWIEKEKERKELAAALRECQQVQGICALVTIGGTRS